MSYGLSLGANPTLRTTGSKPIEGSVALDIAGMLNLESQGIPAIIPSTFADITAGNHIGLLIYENLKVAFSECSDLLAKVGASKYGNLIALFFHEILRVLCSYFTKRFELDYVLDRYQTTDFEVSATPGIASPYVNYDFVLAPDEIRIGHLTRHPSGFHPKKTVRRLIDKINTLTLSCKSGKRQAMLYTCNLQTDIKPLMQKLNRTPKDLSWQLRMINGDSLKVVLPQLESQYAVLLSTTQKIGSDLALAVPNQLFIHLKNWISVYTAESYSDAWNADALLIGSPVTPETRMAAGRAKAQGIPVVSMSHGEATGLFDEPVFGYGENSLVDCVIGYGSLGCRKATDGQYCAPLYDEGVPYIPTASEMILSIYSSKTITRLSEVVSPRIMYVPTSFTANGRYGPYRDVHDVVYLNWQRQLLSVLADGNEGRVSWQIHPGDESTITAPIKGTSFTEKRFENALDDADVFVFDYLSTAFTIAAASNKPMIYLDIGLRNPTRIAMEAIKDRCIYVKADLADPESAWRIAMSMAGKICTNHYTEDYCLSDDKRLRSEIIAEVLNKAANGIYSPIGKSK